MIKPILQDVCYHEGRGPELQAVRYAFEGRIIRAVEFLNPDDAADNGIKHLEFIKPQVLMWTPEEVYNNLKNKGHWTEFRPAAVISLGKSPWLLSFSPQHLTRCSHFQIMFYDEYLDIICESIVFSAGLYHPADDIC
jgi:hypothetical protein